MPVTIPGSYMDILSAGQAYMPAYLEHPDIGPGFLTPDQQEFRARNRVRTYGEDDPNVGGYNMAEVVFDKRDGGATVGMMDVGPSAWYGGRSTGP